MYDGAEPSWLRSTTQLDETEIYALLIAAAAHDFRHPGRTNAFLANTAHDIAITYCEDSSLERMHAGETLKLLSQTRYNCLPRRTAATNDGEAGIATRQTARKVIVKGILSTDLTRSWQYITDFKTHVMPIVEDPDGSEAIAFETNSMARIALTTFLLKCADVSHPVRPLRLHLLWSERILAEFHSQGHEENARGLAISPLCDQAKDEDMEHLGKSQRGARLMPGMETRGARRGLTQSRLYPQASLTLSCGQFGTALRRSRLPSLPSRTTDRSHGEKTCV